MLVPPPNSGLGLSWSDVTSFAKTQLAPAFDTPEVRQTMRGLGVKTADAAMDKLPHLGRRAVQATQVSTPTPSWAAPVVDPFMDGFKTRLKVRAKPLLLQAGIVAATILVLAGLAGFGIGRATTRRTP